MEECKTIDQEMISSNSVNNNQELSPIFSTFIIKVIEYEQNKDRIMNNGLNLSQVLDIKQKELEEIKSGKRNLTIENVFQLEKAYNISISSLLKSRLDSKTIPAKLKKLYASFIKFSKNNRLFIKDITKEGPVSKQKEVLAGKIHKLKEIVEILKHEAKELEEKELGDKNHHPHSHKIKTMIPKTSKNLAPQRVKANL